MEHFLSCDWGTSSFRLRLVEAESLKVIGEIKSGEGIADTYKSWARQQPPTDRQQFYTRIIDARIRQLAAHPDVQQKDISLSDMPVVLSGMASSTIGLIDMPYKQIPFKLDGSDLNLEVLGRKTADNAVIIVSGAKTATDVMRGEETKVVGCAPYLAGLKGEIQLLLPGTHPKHILIKERQVESFKTYMTGEFFDLLARQSVLAASVQEDNAFDDPANRQSFGEGVDAARHGNLLNTAFMVRTRQVLQQVSATQNYHYLSGLLIGNELKELNPVLPVYLLGGSLHAELYSFACDVLDIPVAKIIDADEALIRGQQQLYTANCRL